MTSYSQAVQKLYVAYFCRPADGPGLIFWSNAFARLGGEGSALSAAFSTSQEYLDTYGGKPTTVVVDTIYRNLFGRAAEPAALKFWGNALDNKAMTIDNAVLLISNAAQGGDAIVFANKVAAAEAFSAALHTASYSGTMANRTAKTWLADITTASSFQAATEPGALARTVNEVLQAGSVTPLDVALSVAADIIVGTAGDDSFLASVDAEADSTWNTLGLNDAINGGAGRDTLVLGAFSAVDDTLLSVLKNIEVLELHGDASFRLDSGTVTGLSLINGAAATGRLSITAHSGVEVRGGAGNDVLEVRGILTGQVTLTGGAGSDQFDVSGSAASHAGAMIVIDDFTKNDRIVFGSSPGAGFAKAKLALAPGASLENGIAEAMRLADLAANDHGMAWFQHQDNTLIVQDKNGNGVFDAGTDTIVKLTGLLDLSNAWSNNGGVATLVLG